MYKLMHFLQFPKNNDECWAVSGREGIYRLPKCRGNLRQHLGDINNYGHCPWKKHMTLRGGAVLFCKAKKNASYKDSYGGGYYAWR